VALLATILCKRKRPRNQHSSAIGPKPSLSHNVKSICRSGRWSCGDGHKFKSVYFLSFVRNGVVRSIRDYRFGSRR
jgi:hypothetical protein